MFVYNNWSNNCDGHFGVASVVTGTLLSPWHDLHGYSLAHWMAVTVGSVSVYLHLATKSHDHRTTTNTVKQNVPAWEERCLRRHVCCLINGNNLLILQQRNKQTHQSSRVSIGPVRIPVLVLILSILFGYPWPVEGPVTGEKITLVCAPKSPDQAHLSALHLSYLVVTF